MVTIRIPNFVKNSDFNHATQRRYDMMNNWDGFWGWGMGMGFVFMLLFWGFIILGIAALIRWLMAQSSPSRGARDKTPLEILQQRYARGEIGQEEYEQKKHDLEP
jgi:putative membrane protein